MSTDPAWVGRLDALYALALRLYPARFRNQWEQPMRQAFRDRCREIARGERGRTSLLTELLPDFAFGLGRERIHDLGNGTMFKRNLMFALLVLLGGTIALHDRIGTASNDALQWWKQHQARVHAEAERRYWTDLAKALEPAHSPRGHAVAAIAWQMAGRGNPSLSADPHAASRAQRHWDAAVEGADPAALWLSATDCPVRRCDDAAAIATLQRDDPGNAAVALLVFVHAAKSADGRMQAHARRQLSESPRYHDYEADLLKSLLQANARATAPGHASADELVAGVAMTWAIPDMTLLLDACEPGVGDAMQCRAAARVLASGSSMVAQAVGLRIWNRFAAQGDEAGEVRRRIRNLHWLIANLVFPMDPAARARWRAAWLESDGEVEAYEARLAARAIPLEAPETFQVDPRYLDPSR